jgi:hypothetical protein
MKNLKKPTYTQKQIIEKSKLSWPDWLVKQETADILTVVNKVTNEVKEIKK